MTDEWYVYRENAKSLVVIQGRANALARLTRDAKMTLMERLRVDRLADPGMVPEIGKVILIVGWGDEPDRSIARVELA